MVTRESSAAERLEALARTAAGSFAARFGRTPVWLVAAPGRVNLIGEHTDYSGGFVLPMAIERHVVIAAAPAETGPPKRLRAHSAAFGASFEVGLDEQASRAEPSWSNYVRGVVAGFQRRAARLPSLDVWIVSDIPLGAGLSSSAALEVATATTLEAATGTFLAPLDKVHLCQQAEHEFAGVPCGVMDQMICVLGEEGGALLIDCRAEAVRLTPLADPRVTVLVADTHVRHALGDGAYAARRADCEAAARLLGVASLRDATPENVDAASGLLGSRLLPRARHVVTENARTEAAARALAAGDADAAGSLMYESHRSLRDDYEVSCAELDVLVDVARELGRGAGVHGARMTGGGFGGCTVTLVETERVDLVAEELRRQYDRRTGRKLDVFASRPARGARLLDLVDA